MAYVEKQLSIDDGAEYILNKLERSYQKLTPKGKKLIKARYDAAKLTLSQNTTL